MAEPKIDVALATLGAGFDADSQVTDAPKRSLLKRIHRFFDEWIEHSYEAWIKAGRPRVAI